MPFFYICPLKFNTIERISGSVDVNSRGLIYKKIMIWFTLKFSLKEISHSVLKLEIDFSYSTLVAFPCCFTVAIVVKKTALATWLQPAARPLSKGQKPQQESVSPETLISARWRDREKHAVQKETDLVTSWLTRHCAGSVVMRNMLARKQTLTQHQSTFHWVCSLLFFLGFYHSLFAFFASISGVPYILHWRVSTDISVVSPLTGDSDRGQHCLSLF